MSPARERLVLVAAVAATGAAALLASTQTWVTASVHVLAHPIAVAGSSAAPALAPLGLTMLALAGALAIAGPIARRVLAVVLVLLGALVLAMALPAVTDPGSAVRGSVTAATGLDGPAAVAASINRLVPTAWPDVAVIAGVAAVACGVLLFLRSGRWPAGGRRYRVAAEEAPAASADPIDEWDALSRGADPTAVARRDAPDPQPGAIGSPPDS